MCIRARQPVTSGAGLAMIPKDACITRCTTQIWEILQDEGFSGGLGLVIAVWYERGVGSRSKWAGYFESMNDREHLPVFWSVDELAALEGTEVGDIAADVQDIVDDYEDHVVPLMRKYEEVFRTVFSFLPLSPRTTFSSSSPCSSPLLVSKHVMQRLKLQSLQL